MFQVSFRSLLSMKNGQNLCQLLLRPLMKFGGKVWKIFWTQPFGLGQILPFCLVHKWNLLPRTNIAVTYIEFPVSGFFPWSCRLGRRRASTWWRIFQDFLIRHNVAPK